MHLLATGWFYGERIAACRNRLREERCHQLISIRTGGGGTVEACTELR